MDNNKFFWARLLSYDGLYCFYICCNYAKSLPASMLKDCGYKGANFCSIYVCILCHLRLCIKSI